LRQIIAEIHLVYPYNKSLEILLDLVSTWGMSLLDAKTHKEKATVSIPSTSFKNIFDIKPKKGKLEVPKGTEFFISKMEIIDIKD
jgi:hypothetical protein